MSDYHPSQQIKAEHKALYSRAILESLCSSLTMIGQLDASEPFDTGSLQMPTREVQLDFDQKLGHLYEDALALLLAESPRYALISKNKQIINEGKQTLGELDFLLLDQQTDRHIHLELAIKFYLIHQQEDRFHFPGPDARDNFHRKLERLGSHQLQLTRQEVTRKLLWVEFEIHQITVQHMIHGIFFDHIDAIDHPSPPATNLFCQRRHWLHAGELQIKFPQLKTARVIPKALWSCEITAPIYDTLVAVERDELIELAQQRCTMFLEKAADKPSFLAPDSWPKAQ